MNTVSVGRALEASVTSRVVPRDLVVAYDDTHGLWGGVAIVIRGSGSGERREQPPGAAEPEVFARAVSEDELSDLVNLLVALEAWQQQMPERQPVPDESRATLTVSVGGEVSSIWERYNAMVKHWRLVQIKMKMIEMTASP